MPSRFDATTHLVVNDNKEVVGFCSPLEFLGDVSDIDFFLEPHDDGRTALDFANKVNPSRIVSDNTPFHKAVHFFASSESPYCILNADQIVGIYRPHHVLHPRALFCYLALTLDLETAALDLCTWFSDGWHSLSKDRQDAARETYVQKFHKLRKHDWEALIEEGVDSESKSLLIRDILQCTNFCDKSTIICKSKLLIDQSNTRVQKVFGRAQRVRNACAHPLTTDDSHPDRWPTDHGDLFDMTPGGVSEFVKDCLGMIDSIKAVLPKAGSGQ